MAEWSRHVRNDPNQTWALGLETAWGDLRLSALELPQKTAIGSDATARFIATLNGAAVTPFTTLARQFDPVRRIGVLEYVELV